MGSCTMEALQVMHKTYAEGFAQTLLMQALQAIAGISFSCRDNVHTYHASINNKIGGSTA